MKKISLIALALTTSLAMFAQDNQLTTPMAKKTYFGLTGGVNLATFRVNDYEPHIGTNMKTTWHGGIFANIPLSGPIYLQPEAIYSGQGSKLVEYTTTGTRVSSEQDLGYIAVPIMFQFKSTKGFFVELGPQPAFLIKGQKEMTDGSESDNKSSFDNFDIALNGGIGYTSRIGLGLHARYSWGLSNTLEDGGGNNSSNSGPELKNSVVQIGLHYMFGAYK